MDLGNFSVSLAVKDLNASLAFYEKLGFQRAGGDVAQRWVVLQNGNARIGLFQGMFDRNMLTFNPGWTKDRQVLTDFQDVRELQRLLQGRGLSPAPVIDADSDGPAHFMLTDPDGNPVLIDQHLPRPRR
ncbi:MAG: VOC family protein [Rubrivivax sp.]|nr:MAG: VOC family protein [Rubrivivax sp.]